MCRVGKGGGVGAFFFRVGRTMQTQELGVGNYDMMAGFSNLQERLLKGPAKTSRLDYLVYIKDSEGRDCIGMSR